MPQLKGKLPGHLVTGSLIARSVGSHGLDHYGMWRVAPIELALLVTRDAEAREHADGGGNG